MNFWVQNKRLIVVAAVALLSYLLLWPSIIGNFRRPWASPMIVRPYRGQYCIDLEEADSRHEQKLQVYYDEAGESAIDVARLIEEHNEGFRKANNTIYQTILFVPRSRFIPDPERGSPGEHFMRVVPKVKTSVADYMSDRNVDSPYHIGFDIGDTPTENVELMFKQLQAVEELCRRAGIALKRKQTNVQYEVSAIDEVAAYKPLPDDPDSEEDDLLKITPLKIRVHCGFKQLMAFLASLHGRHGRVTRVDRSGRSKVAVTIEMRTEDSLSVPQLFTVCRSEDMSYAGTVEVTRARPDNKLVTGFVEEDNKKNPIKVGDYVTTGFFSLLDIRIKSIEAKPEKRGSPKVIPGHLDALVYVGIIELREKDAESEEPLIIESSRSDVKPSRDGIPTY